MSPRLKSITVEDFRSIRGQISISLDAPVVLIHGPNGAGKTSLLSAVELGLTGDVPSLRRVDPDYLEHLPHKLAPNGRGRVALEVEGLNGSRRTELSVTRQSVEVGHLLSEGPSRFFSERCYLAQSTLGRLLEIYQHQDTRKTDSPLTQFVKDLLGLDQLDALIDGLHSAGDVRRLRDSVPVYWSARQDIPEIEGEIAGHRQEVSAFDSEDAVIEQRLQTRLATLIPDLQSAELDLQDIQSRLRANDDEITLQALARSRRDISAIAEQWRSISAGPGAPARQAVEQEDTHARQALEKWNATVGISLKAVIDELRTTIPDIQTTATGDSEVVRKGATSVVEAELHRINEILVRDEGDERRATQLRASIEQGKARTSVLDQQIVEAAGVNEGLAQALTEIVPHIHGEDCPVCSRDFSEVSATPLSAHLSARISSLVETSGRLQVLARDKASTGASVATAERELGVLIARQLSSAQRDELKSKKARFDELRLRLAGLQQGTMEGSALSQRAVDGARRLAELRSGDQAVTSLRLLVEGLAGQLSQAAFDASEPIDIGVSRLQAYVEQRERELQLRQALRRAALDDADELRGVRERRAQVQQKVDLRQTELERLALAKSEADRRIDLAKDLARRTRERRTSIVRRVFNDELNAVWRDLFVRLAPEEPFVPAFALPDSPTGPVEAVLETHFREGGKGGNPRAMLSAGNLNTAALTLFLALHLSVKPILPWLVIDDPVQSMDEVHIAQFAALLRTLSKQKGRQIIIAVHERPLFEYLSLELSPAFLDDRLITVELTRTADGMTTATWEPRTYEPDRAIAA